LVGIVIFMELSEQIQQTGKKQQNLAEQLSASYQH
jgi:hypothetical protein